MRSCEKAMVSGGFISPAAGSINVVSSLVKNKRVPHKTFLKKKNWLLNKEVLLHGFKINPRMIITQKRF